MGPGLLKALISIDADPLVSPAGIVTDPIEVVPSMVRLTTKADCCGSAPSGTDTVKVTEPVVQFTKVAGEEVRVSVVVSGVSLIFAVADAGSITKFSKVAPTTLAPEIVTVAAPGSTYTSSPCAGTE